MPIPRNILDHKAIFVLDFLYQMHQTLDSLHQLGHFALQVMCNNIHRISGISCNMQSSQSTLQISHVCLGIFLYGVQLMVASSLQVGSNQSGQKVIHLKQVPVWLEVSTAQHHMPLGRPLPKLNMMTSRSESSFGLCLKQGFLSSKLRNRSQKPLRERLRGHRIAICQKNELFAMRTAEEHLINKL